MDAFAPYEPPPVLAVAVSGGPDSLCLTLLADRWARAKGGRIEAVTVDHGLRPESAAEARQVGRWLKPRGIRHLVLRWDGDKPTADLAAAARDARYRLILGWAADRGILHLLLAHHLDDQAETLLLRLARGSGVDGLSAMAGAVELGSLRLLRPLLDVPKAALVARLRQEGQAWVEDPGNRAGASARSRVRLALEREGLSPRRLAETAARLSRARHALDHAAAALAAQAVEAHPCGFLRVDPAPLAAAPSELSLRVLARCLMAVSGNPYPPRLERLERLAEGVLHNTSARGQTLHGCQWSRAGGRWLVVREAAAIQPPVAAPAVLAAGADGLWDRRFRIAASAIKALPRGATIGALGAAGHATFRAALESLGIPRAAALAMPGFYGRNDLLGAPFLGLAQGARTGLGGGRKAFQADRIINQSAVFLPTVPLAPLGYAVALATARTI